MFNASTVPRMCFNIEITRDNIEEGAVPEEFALLLLILDGPAAPDISFLPLVAIHDSNGNIGNSFCNASHKLLFLQFSQSVLHRVQWK